jgi:hypothetical protein
MSNRGKKQIREPKQADRWGVNACPDGHLVLQLLDRGGKAFAEAHGFDPDALICTVLTGENEPFCQCVAGWVEVKPGTRRTQWQIFADVC